MVANEYDEHALQKLLRFYADECDPDDILSYTFPRHTLQMDEQAVRNILAYSPLFTSEEKKVIIDQFAYMKQQEFNNIIADITRSHAVIKKHLEGLDSLTEKNSLHVALNELKNNL